MKRQQNDLHRNLKNIRDYNFSNGYAHAGTDAGREARGLLVTLFRLGRSVFSLLGAVVGGGRRR
jgi:hypothetical protein